MLFCLYNNVACEEVSRANNENEADVSIGTEIPDLDTVDEMIQTQDSAHSNECSRESPSTSYAGLYIPYDDHGNFESYTRHSLSISLIPLQSNIFILILL